MDGWKFTPSAALQPWYLQVTKENSIATAGVLGGVTGLLLGGFWAPWYSQAAVVDALLGLVWLRCNIQHLKYLLGSPC